VYGEAVAPASATANKGRKGMRNLKRMLILSGLTALASVAAAGPAQAQNVGACAVEGTGTFSPPMQIIGGSGTYKFDSSAGAGLQWNCVIGTANHGSGVATLSVTSTGNYVNDVCGTFEAHSADLDPVNPPTGGNDITAVNVRAGNLDALWAEQQETKLEYDMRFVGTVGSFRFRPVAGNAQGVGLFKMTDPSPEEIDPSTNTCTSDFALTGAWAGSLAE
jgi:hypothetical protein